MERSIDLDDIKNKLIDRLRESGWADKLKGFLMSSDFDKILEYLYDQREEGKRFTPMLKDMFSAFEDCPYNKLKVVLVGQDPYYQINIADGKAFSCSKTGVLQPSLDYIFKAIDRTVYPEDGIPDVNPDLTRWANQGVLLLNTALTTEIGKPAMHQKIWAPFIAYLLDILDTVNSGLVFVFMGKVAQDKESLISETRHFKLYCTHPASAAYKKEPLWESNDVFVKTNTLLRELNNENINW